MTTGRWQQIKAIFDDAVECDPGLRAAFVRQQCEDDEELLREVESLLAADNATVAAVLQTSIITQTKLVFKDRYEILKELGRGGMSVVYLAADRQLLSKNVVIKVLLEETSQDPWMQQKFMQEMEALARIDHPGVVGVLDTGLTVGGQQFLVMQYVEGSTLRTAITPGGMSPIRAAGIIRQIGSALAAVHEKGVWHRDLKPENIMLQRLSGEDHVKLIDFGIAGIQNSQFRGRSTKVAGSLRYMAPEQFAGQACAASDTYALAVMAYELLTGALPKPLDESASDLRPHPLPEAVEQSIRKALQFRPELRHGESREFSEELYQVLTGDKSSRRLIHPGEAEMAHVLFGALEGAGPGELQQIVHNSAQFRTAEQMGDMVSVSTSSGMAMAFFGDPAAPARCALELAASVKLKSYLRLRMGIHTGPVFRATDGNSDADLASGGIAMAQQVMDCGDAGHILMSKSVADVLCQLSQWSPYVTDLGECTTKQGVKVHLCSLATPQAGNSTRPLKLEASKKVGSKAITTVLALLMVGFLALAFWLGRMGIKSQSTQEQPSIAVLPFLDLSPEKDQLYFSDGITEELLDALTRIPGLRVAARSAAFRFRDNSENVSVIGKQLNVSTVLMGSVRKQGNRTRITTELVKTADGFHLWSNTFERDMSDVFAVQEEIARAVITALKITLGEKWIAPTVKTTNVNAHNAYLQGRRLLWLGDKSNIEKAILSLKRAIQLDPNYAPSWLQLGEAHNVQTSRGYLPADIGGPLARGEIERALTLDPDLADAHTAMGRLKMLNDLDWLGAAAYFRRSLQLAPGKSSAISQSANLARTLGHFDESVALSRQYIAADPLSPGGFHNAGLSFYSAGLLAEAVVAFKKALELAPGKEVTHASLAEVYLAQGRLQEALDEARAEKNVALSLWAQALAQYALRRNAESDLALKTLIEKYSKEAPFEIAEVHAFRQDKDQAFEWLEKAYAAHDSGLTQLKAEPTLKNLHQDPRYTAFLKKLRLSD